MTEKPEENKVSRRGALKIGVAAVVGLGVGIVATDVIQSQKISNLSSTISTLNTSISGLNTSVSSLDSNASNTASALANQPFYVDTVNKQIVLQAVANKAANTGATIVCCAWDQGSAAPGAMFTSTATPEQVYDGLMSLGATPGNAVQLTSPTGTLETGTQLDITITWEGANEIPIEQVVTEYTGTEFVFGGNLSTNESAGTGCEICLFSCAVAITSSGDIGWKTSSGWTLNSSVVPVGQAVTIYIKPVL